jgi:hypothetical protein
MNDFLANLDSLFFKAEIELCLSKSMTQVNLSYVHAYIVVTDMHLLIFTDKIKTSQNISKLNFVGEIRHIKSIKGVKVFTKDKTNSTGISIEWLEGNSIDAFRNILILPSDKFTLFVDSINWRIKRISDNFSFFHDDLTKTNFASLSKYSDYETTNIIDVIKHRESLIEKTDDVNQFNLRELMLLYQRIIEIYSAQNNYLYLTYMEKLRSLIENTKFE